MIRGRERISAAVGLLAMAVAIFAIGGAPRWAQAATAIGVAAALVPMLGSRRVMARWSPLYAAICAAIAVTLVQLLPLPARLVALLDPTGAALRADGNALFAVETTATLTRDVPGSLRALAFFLTLLGVAVITLRLSTTTRGRYWINAAVAGTCGMLALVVGAHALLGATALYGLYVPSGTTPQLLGPLINTNHLGCLLAIGATTSLGLVAYPRQHSALRIVWLVTALSCLGLTLATWSRGAAVAIAGGALTVVLTVIAQTFRSADLATRRKRTTHLTTSIPLGIVAVCGVAVVLLVSAGGVTEQLSRTSLGEVREPRSKFAIWRSAMTLIEESPWVGVGRGGFEPSFTRIHEASAYSTYSHVENEYLQAIVDWGVPAAIVLAVLLAWFAVTAARRWADDALAASALGALVVVGLQSNFDFGIEMLAIAVPSTALAATLTSTPLREVAGRASQVARGVRALHIVALLAAAGLLMTPWTTSLAEEHDELASRPQTMETLAASARRHPHDYYPYTAAAQLMMRSDNREAIRMLNHALLLHPTNAGTHLLAARMLYAAGRHEQATIEYATALRGSTRRAQILAEVLQRFPTELAARALPVNDSRFEQLAQLLTDELQRIDVAALWMQRSLELHPDNLAVCVRLYALAAFSGDVGLADTVERRCPSFEPSHARRNHLARVLLEKGAPAEALRVLGDVTAWRGVVDDKVAGWLTACDAQIALQAWDDAKRCVRQLEATGLVGAERSGELSSRLSTISASRSLPRPP